MSDNLKIYNQVRQVPQEAQKSIGGGRLRGMTDINPMWRIKMLTTVYGQAGIGWYTDNIKQWLEEGADGEIVGFCNLTLFVKVDGEWSKGIFGTGGSSFVANEKNGKFTSDECYKMAYTDALSVACKAIGMGADVYWQKDNTKYNSNKEETVSKIDTITSTEAKDFAERLIVAGKSEDDILKWAKIKKLTDLPRSKYEVLIKKL